jgi:hypothetical protein
MATFDPNSITPPEELLVDWAGSYDDSFIHDNSLFKDYIVAARWGAAQAFEALRHQWPEPITDRPPTEEDADECGFVQYLFCGKWNFDSWDSVAKNQHQAWFHTPNWRPKPEPTLKQQAIEILDTVFPCTPEQAETLRAALDLIPEEDD